MKLSTRLRIQASRRRIPARILRKAFADIAAENMQLRVDNAVLKARIKKAVAFVDVADSDRASFAYRVVFEVSGAELRACRCPLDMMAASLARKIIHQMKQTQARINGAAPVDPERFRFPPLTPH